MAATESFSLLAMLLLAGLLPERGHAARSILPDIGKDTTTLATRGCNLAFGPNFIVRWAPSVGAFSIVKGSTPQTSPVFANPTGQPFLFAAQGPANPASTYSAAVHVLRSTVGSQTDIQTVEYSINWQASADASSRGITLNRLVIRFAASQEEAFYGLGIQTSSWMHNGRSIPVMNLEPGVGKGEVITTVAENLASAGDGGSPFSAYTSIPHLFSSAKRSFVLYDSKLSVFDLTATAVPRLPTSCPTCGGGPLNRAKGVVIPRNQKHDWRCTTASSPDYLAAIQTNKFMAMKFVYDVLQPIIQTDRQLVQEWLLELVAGQASIEGLLSQVYAWVAQNHPEWLPYINPQGTLGQSMDVITVDTENVTASGDINPDCFQCAHQDCSAAIDASWMPLVPFSAMMRSEACSSGRGIAVKGLAPPQVQVLVYIQPGEDQLVSGFLLSAPDTEAQLEAYTEYSGRVRKLPSWVNNGAIISITGGTELLLERYNILKDADVPMSAVWSQDWPGLRLMGDLQRLWWNWRLDNDYYTNYTALQEYLRGDDVLMTLYANPYLANDLWGNDSSTYQMYSDGLAKNVYVQCAGTPQPYISWSVTTDFSYSTVDLTNPDARQWFAEQLAEKLYKQGMSVGYMSDFADQTPFDPKAVMYDGRSAAVMRNRFPEFWAMTSRMAMDAAGLSDEGLAWTRSASSLTPTYSTVMWLGDQNVVYDAFDGMKSALIGALSAGLSGLTIVHSDIGGYVASSKLLSRTKELLLRWTEMSSVTDAIMRTHISTDPSTWQVWSPGTPAPFGWLVRIHQALQPYREEVLQEAYTRGLPMVRHPMLYFTNDKQVAALQFQVMLGRHVMFCPALDGNQRTVDCYLPGQSGDLFPVWGVSLPASQLTAEGAVKCVSTVSSKPCWIRMSSPILPGGNPLTGDVTPEGCPPLLVHRSGLQGIGLKAALDNLRALASKNNKKCGGVLLN